MKQISSILVILAVVLSFTLVFSDIQNALAFSITYYDAGAGANGIARIGNQIAISQTASNQVIFKSASSPATTTGTITSVTGANGLAPNSAGSRLYTFATTLYYELDPVNYAVLRSVAHGCAITEGNFFDSDNNMMYCVTSTETVKAFSMNSMSNTFTSTTMNAGGSPCVVAVDIQYEAATDTMFASCTGPVRVVAVVGLAASGTPDFAVSPTGSPNSIAWNTREDNLLVCKSSGSIELFNYTAGFTLWHTFESANCGGTINNDMYYDSTSDRFLYQTTNDVTTLRDGTNGDSLFTITHTGGGEDQVFVVSNDLSYLANVVGAVGTDFAVFDMTGINLGSSGDEEPDTGGGVDCTLPENTNILICRLTGNDGQCVNGVLQCIGDTVLGNSTDNSDVGLIDIICGVGFIDCADNPNIKTNGIGYLLLAAALGIEIGILWVASRGDLREVPTFIWFIATIAIVGSLTLMNFIDPTFLVLSVITVVALAAAKARGLFGGGDSF